jgi:signal transduction histidine kinase
LLKDPTRIIETELRLWGGRDSWRWMSVRYLVLTTTPDGRPQQILITAWDITQQKGAETQAGQLALETQRSSLLKNLVETFSHDLNTPLTIAMTAEYMTYAYAKRYAEQHPTPDANAHAEALKLTEQVKAQHEKIAPALERLKSIIGNMIEMVQLDYDLKLNYNLIDLDLVVDQAVRQLRTRMQEHHPSLHRTDSPGLPTGRYDIEHMQQAITNLLNNAVTATPDEGSITVRTFERGNDLVIEVTDTGIGIPEASLPRIFDRFYRVDAARRGTTGSNGLGLSIAKRVVEGHGGHIEVESEVGKGSTFRIVVPLRY